MKSTRIAGARQAVVVLALFAGASGCTADDVEAADEPTAPTSSSPSQAPASQAPASQAPATQAPAAQGTAPEDEDRAVVDEPAVRPADNPGDGSANHWIGRGLMTSSSVDLAWSPLDGAEVSYRIHRFAKGDGFDPELADLAEGTVVYDGPDTSFTDTGVEADLFYYYLLEANVDGQTLPVRWTEALTKDDTEPPTAVTGLTAVSAGDGEVLLSWAPSSDNVEFAAYAVFLVDGEDSTYIGGGADVGETSFLDDRVPSLPVTYSVVAVDFHDNRSTPAIVTVELD